eukprot:TRINITY_DN8229_c0_g1_i1.p1 TRINITY_DN8229_c0_g1~~TRINITY_DN8229_c0_g1_i1.p1  ORF type:complete len:463 (-),score=81.57 TRINITY_DN8229_c0_g1_i1:323-1711(-)
MEVDAVVKNTIIQLERSGRFEEFRETIRIYWRKHKINTSVTERVQSFFSHSLETRGYAKMTALEKLELRNAIKLEAKDLVMELMKQRLEEFLTCNEAANYFYDSIKDVIGCVLKGKSIPPNASRITAGGKKVRSLLQVQLLQSLHLEESEDDENFDTFSGNSSDADGCKVRKRNTRNEMTHPIVRSSKRPRKLTLESEVQDDSPTPTKIVKTSSKGPYKNPTPSESPRLPQKSVHQAKKTSNRKLVPNESESDADASENDATASTASTQSESENDRGADNSEADSQGSSEDSTADSSSEEETMSSQEEGNESEPRINRGHTGNLHRTQPQRRQGHQSTPGGRRISSIGSKHPRMSNSPQPPIPKKSGKSPTSIHQHKASLLQESRLSRDGLLGSLLSNSESEGGDSSTRDVRTSSRGNEKARGSTRVTLQNVGSTKSPKNATSPQVRKPQHHVGGLKSRKSR